MTVNIYESENLISSRIYTLKYTPDNINGFELKKSTGVIQFSIPLISGDQNLTTNMIKQQSEFIHINGIEAGINLSFEVDPADVRIIQDFIQNQAAKTYLIANDTWPATSGSTSGSTFEGIFDSIRVKQNGGDPRVTVDASFLYGSNTMSNLGL